MAVQNFDHDIEQRDETVLKGVAKTEFDFGQFDHSHLEVSEHVPVIILGSSMVGMSLGVFLGYYGIKSVNFDRHPSTATHPRAALFLLRTMEIFRQMGIEPILESESAKTFDLNAGMLMVESLVGGKVIFRMQEADPAKTAKITPSKRLWLTQNMFEPALRKEARRFGARQIFGTSIFHYEESKDGVIVVTKDLESGGIKKYSTEYLVACDGNRSPARRKEGIEWKGPGVVGNNLSINFTADLTPYLGTRAVHGVTYVNNQDISAGFRLEDNGKAGFLIVSKTRNRVNFEPDSVTATEAKEMFYMASGLREEIPLKIDSIAYWSTAALNAEKYASSGGRVFLAGDAAHVMPPTGGMGGNTGIQDVWNLAWKLAYVLNRHASPSLLHSYNAERQPTVDKIMHQAYARLVNRVLPDKSIPHDKELPDDTCELGYRYVNGAIVSADTEGAHEAFEDPHSPSVLPGSRMPHVQLSNMTRDSSKLSTLDLLKQSFLMIGIDDSDWISAARAQEVPVDAHVLSKASSPIYDPEEEVKRIYKLREGHVVLIRPDGWIAWRSDLEQSDAAPSEVLGRVLQTVLAF